MEGRPIQVAFSLLLAIGSRPTRSASREAMVATLRIDAVGDWLSIRGELDGASAPALAHAVSTLRRSLVLDMRDVTFIDSGGVQVLVTIAETRSIRVCSASVSPFAMRLFKLLGVDGIVLDGCPSDGGGACHRTPLPET
jgi:anti-anti-sigma factor